MRLEARQEAEERDGAVTENNVLEELEEDIPTGRLGQSENLAGAVLFLPSDGPEYMVGPIVCVAGGGNLS